MQSLIEDYFQNAERWKLELAQLREIVLGCGLREQWKWQVPVYTFENHNIVTVSRLNGCVVLSFFKGALLQDPAQVLQKPGPNTRAARVIRFTQLEEIQGLRKCLELYIQEAMQIERDGLVFHFKSEPPLPIPSELQQKFTEQPHLLAAFNRLTPGRQRAYLLFFSEAKQSQTRLGRIEKYASRILAGQGINDCTCGLSKKLPACDGSHKRFVNSTNSGIDD